jgi:hypothetical protein
MSDAVIGNEHEGRPLPLERNIKHSTSTTTPTMLLPYSMVAHRKLVVGTALILILFVSVAAIGISLKQKIDSLATRKQTGQRRRLIQLAQMYGYLPAMFWQRPRTVAMAMATSRRQRQIQQSIKAQAPSSSSSPSSGRSSLKARRRSEGQSYAPFVAGLGITFVMLYLLWMISQIDSHMHINMRQQGKVGLVPSAKSRIQSMDITVGQCQYDGHCPVRSTCEANTVATSTEDSGGARGTCGRIESRGQLISSAETTTAANTACVDACRTELEMDEHFYQETWPVVEWSESVPASEGRPSGCMVVYHREPEGDRYKALQEKDDHTDWTEIPPSVRSWTEKRFRHVIRVDPVSDNVQDNKWMAYCHNTCVTDADCAVAVDDENEQPAPAFSGIGPVPAFTCQQSACQRNTAYWNPNINKEDTATTNMLIITGATTSYFKGLQNLCASLRYWAPHHKVVVYNLGGMTPQQIKQIQSWTNVISVEWLDGVPAKYPKHVQKGKLYAWKPIIIEETVRKYKSIFWLDAGNTVAGPITPIENVIQRTGIMLVKGQDNDMKLKSFKKTYEWFNTTKATFQAGPHYSGNTQAFMYPSRYYDSVILPDSICAMDKKCIAPSGSGLNNHRYDQTTISILAYHPKVRAPHYTEFLAADKKQLNPDLSKPSFKMIWTTRMRNEYYTDNEQKLLES